MTTQRLTLLAVCAALAAPALTSTIALAQPNPIVDAATLARSRELFEKANKLYDQGRLKEAEAAYLDAWKLKKSYDVAGNLGNLEFDMGKPREAAGYLAFALREFPAGGKPALRDALVKRLAEAEARIGTLRVLVSKPGAEVFVDRRSMGLSPLPDDVYVDPGSHSIEARLEGFPPALLTVAVDRGATQTVNVPLKEASANRAVLIAGGAAAGAAAVTGVVFLVLMAGKSSDVTTLYDKARSTGGCGAVADASKATGTCADLQSALNGKATFANVGTWTLVAAGAASVGTLVYGLVAPRVAASKSGLSVTPVVTAQGGGLSVVGAW